MSVFRNIFSFFLRLFGLGKEEVPTGPQDGSEIPTDSVEVVVSTPIEDEPVIEDPIVDEPVIDDPIVDEPIIDDPVVDDPIVDDPVVDDPIVDESALVPQFMWCIDNGHGVATPGKRSPAFENGERFFEYKFNRKVSALIMQKMDALELKYFEVTPETEGDVSLSVRCQRANRLSSDLPKIFLSIHANAFGNGLTWDSRNVRGIETWFFGGSANGKRIASAFHRELIAHTGFNDRGLRYKEPFSRSFYVLRKTSMPAILTENGYYTSRSECEQLLSSDMQANIAQAHVDAILAIEKNGIAGIPIYNKVTKI